MIMTLIRLMRLYYTLPLSAGLIVITAYVTGGNLNSVEHSLALAFAALCSVISGGYVLNDVCDIAVDAINAPHRMLPRRMVTRRIAITFSIILFAVGIALASFCGTRYTIVLAAVAAGLALYDIFGKRLKIFKDVLVAVLVTSLYPLAFTLAQPASTPALKSLFIFPAWLFLTAMGYEMLKDIRDFKGDSAATDQRFQRHCDKPKFLLAARMIIFSASLLTILPVLLGYCQWIYLATSITAIILASLSLKRPPQKAIRFIYAEVFLITAGSLVDLLVFAP
jgi:geranylgeranylglycerol-phosphate geranylgeranyltransferase